MIPETMLNDCVAFGVQNNEDDKTIKNATNAIKNDLVNYCSKINEEQEISSDYQRILKSIIISIKMFANFYYKNSTYLEISDIEHIKDSLNNYENKNKKINEFKQKLIEDLTQFQTEIKTKHIQRINDLIKERQFCEKQVKVLEFEKNKLITIRLSKIIWPYDKKTKEYDSKIAQLELKTQQCINKIENLRKMKPIANEKDILIYNLHLKEKFAKRS